MMSLFRSIKNLFRSQLKVFNPTVVETPEPEVVSSAEKALTIAAVWRCSNLISTSIAGLPILFEKNRAGIYSAEQTTLSYLLSIQPNPCVSAFDFWRQAINNVLFFGEAFIVPRRGDITGETVLFQLATAGTVSRTEKLGVYYINDMLTGIEGTFYEEELIHLKGVSLYGQDCLSVLSAARISLSVAATADDNTLTQFANGGASMGIITNEQGVPGYGQYQGEALQRIANEMTYALKKGERIIAVPGKAEYHNFGMTAADMQFLESRKFSVEEICRFFSVPPLYAFCASATELKAMPQAQVLFQQTTLDPYLKQIENELGRKLLTMAQSRKYRFRYNREELYATDLEGKMRYMEKRIQTGTLTVNEARKVMGLAPVDGGDEPLVSANLRPVSQISTPPAAPTVTPPNQNDETDNDTNDETGKE